MEQLKNDAVQTVDHLPIQASVTSNTAKKKKKHVQNRIYQPLLVLKQYTKVK